MTRAQNAAAGPMANPFLPLFEQLASLQAEIAQLREEISQRNDVAFAEELCTPKEAAEVLRCSVSNVHTLRGKGVINYVRPDVKVYRKSDLLAIGKEK